MKFYNKITNGFVVQKYVKLGNGKSVCVGQDFVAGDPVDYEDMDGKSIDVDTLKEVYQPFEMKEPKQVGEDGVKFVCPDCKGTQLECCEDGPYVSDVLNIDEEGDFDYGEISASGDVTRYQCSGCGYTLIANEGFGEYPVTEQEDVVEWCKKNCK